MPLTDQEKEFLISEALMTDSGRTALAQAMCEPISRALDYQGVGRRLLMVDELPEGAHARYERDVAAVAWVIERRQEGNIIEKEEISDPIESRFDILDI